jgi:hypothetical protein
MTSEEPKGGLQFERAEYDQSPAGLACAACQQKVWDVYYAVNGQVACERCRADLEIHASQGSGVGRFLRATLYGLGAGAVGAGVWYAVRAVSGYELGLIAIGVGLGVGVAVRKGSNGRGGWRYQALAMLLTYGSIVSTYVPDVLSGLKQMSEAEGQAAASPAPPPPSGNPAPASQGAAASQAAAAPQDAKASADDPPPQGIGLVLAAGVFLLFVLAIAFAAPFLGGFENIMGIVIIGIALYEAWKINRKVPLEVTGPHRVGTDPPPPPVAPLAEA